jgi:MFS family permease
VIEPLKHELGLTDRGIGLITGLGYAIAFACAVVPLGMLADRVNRVRLLSILLTIWSSLTALGGLAQGFRSLFAARVGVGAAEAGLQPTAMSLIADLFPPRLRSTATAIFIMGGPLGYGVAFVVCSRIAAAYGWREAFLVAGIPGLILALTFVLTVAEPTRGRFGKPVEAGTAPPFSAVIRTMAGRSELRLLFLGQILASAVTTGLMVWLIPLLMRQHGVGLPTAGLIGAIATGVFQTIGMVIGGVIADRVAAKKRSRMLLVSALSAALITPAALALALAGNASVAVVMAMIMAVTLSGWPPPTYAIALDLVEPAMRARTISLLMIGATSFGSGFGPWIIGALSDHYGGQHGLAQALATVSPLGLAAGLIFYLASRGAARALAD